MAHPLAEDGFTLAGIDHKVKDHSCRRTVDLIPIEPRGKDGGQFRVEFTQPYEFWQVHLHIGTL